MKNKFLAIAIMAIIFAGCATQQGFIKLNPAVSAETISQNPGWRFGSAFDVWSHTSLQASYWGWSHFFLGGILQTSTLNAARICGGVDKVEAVEGYISFGNGLVTILTLALYTPHTVQVYCK